METETLLAQYQHFMQDPALVRLHRDLLARMRADARAMEQEGAGQWRVSALHTGELDVSHFSVVTPALQSRKGKYVVALLHGSLTFEMWLSAANLCFVGGALLFGWFAGVPLWGGVLLAAFLQLGLGLMWFGDRFVLKMDSAQLTRELKQYQNRLQK